MLLVYPMQPFEFAPRGASCVFMRESIVPSPSIVPVWAQQGRETGTVFDLQHDGHDGSFVGSIASWAKASWMRHVGDRYTPFAAANCVAGFSHEVLFNFSSRTVFLAHLHHGPILGVIPKYHFWLFFLGKDFQPGVSYRAKNRSPGPPTV